MGGSQTQGEEHMTDQERKAMEMAFEALEYYRSGEDYQPTPASEAIHTLRQALAQPEQDISYTDIQMAELIMSDCGHSSDYTPLLDRIAGRLATYRQALAQPEQTKCPRCGEVNPAEIHTCSPQVAQSEQEPVAWLEYDDEGYLFLSGKRKGAFPVFIAPPKQWVGLTEYERNYYNDRLSGSRVAEDIEFELRSRNEKN